MHPTPLPDTTALVARASQILALRGPERAVKFLEEALRHPVRQAR
jgi:hypothetical protein